MKGRTVIILTMMLVVLAGLVLADYAGLLGVTEKPEYVLQEINLRLTDSVDNSPIVYTRAKCFQNRNAKACSQRDSGQLGIVSVIVPATRVVSRSYLFEQGQHFLLNQDPNIQIMLIHTDYVTQVSTIDLNRHFSTPAKIYPVSMQHRGSETDSPE